MLGNGSGRRADTRNNQVRRVGALAVFILVVVAVGFGASGDPVAIGNSVGAYHSNHDGAQGAAYGGPISMNWLRDFLRRPSPAYDKYATAMRLTNEVEQTMRSRSASPDPFRSLMAELWLQHHDVALVADSFQSHQESRIYKGPPE